ncbi:hypothetical protein MRB53_041996 [Persea americana]|nr:hypothetical protein MRB53_041996 [Persea americana]
MTLPFMDGLSLPASTSCGTSNVFCLRAFIIFPLQVHGECFDGIIPLLSLRFSMIFPPPARRLLQRQGHSMLTACGPLIFLNTTNADAPHRTNVRVQARSASARQLNPPIAGPGHFETFAIDAKREPRAVKRKARRKAEADEPAAARAALSRFPRGRRGVEPQAAFFPLTTQVQWINGPIIALVKLEDALEIAAFHIRRSTAQIVRSQPENILTALRSRRISIAPSNASSRRVNMIVSGCPYQSRSRMLTSYSRALRLLRAAVMESHELAGVRDVFAASQLLAIYEMLDFPQSDSWIQHISGAATIARLHTLEKMGSAGVLGHAAPMFVRGARQQRPFLLRQPTLADAPHLHPRAPVPEHRRRESAIECFGAMREIFAAPTPSATLPPMRTLSKSPSAASPPNRCPPTHTSLYSPRARAALEPQAARPALRAAILRLRRPTLVRAQLRRPGPVPDQHHGPGPPDPRPAPRRFRPLPCRHPGACRPAPPAPVPAYGFRRPRGGYHRAVHPDDRHGAQAGRGPPRPRRAPRPRPSEPDLLAVAGPAPIQRAHERIEAVV